MFQITGPAYENEHSAALVFVRGICSKVLSFCERRKYLEDTGMVSKLDRYSALIWQKEASDKSDISRKRAKCVCHLH